MEKQISTASTSAFSQTFQTQSPLYPPDPNEPFARQLLISNFDQQALNRARIVLVGLGGASILARFLVRAGCGELVLLDPDRVSVSNWPRQEYTRAEVLAFPPPFKVFALGRRLLADAPGPLKVVSHALTLQQAYERGVNLQASAAVCLVDNHPGRRCAHDIFARLGMPVIYAGFSPNADRFYVFIEERNDSAPCIGCVFPSLIDSQRYFPCSAQSAELPLMASGLLLYAVTSTIMSRPRTWNYREFGLSSGSFDVSARWQKTADCPLCSRQEV